jgi:amino acid adenylation domain-containing protein
MSTSSDTQPRTPLSSAQLRLWLLDQIQGHTPQYNVRIADRLTGTLDVPALEWAINQIVRRHDVLRTRFESIDGSPAQVVEERMSVRLLDEDLADLPREEREDRIQAVLRSEGTTAFDLTQAPLMRVRLLRVARDEHVLIRTVHHIVWDGWSAEVFNRELSSLYLSSENDLLPPLTMQYRDFCGQRSGATQHEFQNGLSYWTNRLRGVPDHLDLPTDKPRPPHQTFQGRRHIVRLGADDFEKLKRSSIEADATVFTTLVAALGIVIGRHARQEDLVIATPVANRLSRGMSSLIGFFANTLPIRIELNPRESLAGFLARVRDNVRGAMRHQDVPFDAVVASLAPKRRLDATPLAQVMLAFGRNPPHSLHLRGLCADEVLTDSPQVKFDLEIHVSRRQDELVIAWVYNTELFEHWRIEQMAGDHLRTLAAIIQRPDQLVGDCVASSATRPRWTAASDQPAMWRPVHRRFEATVLQMPDAIAASAGHVSATFCGLNRQANRLARFLLTKGVGPEHVVAIRLEPSIDAIAATLAVAKTGAAYLPIDVDEPLPRVSSIMADASVTLVIMRTTHWDDVVEKGVLIDDDDTRRVIAGQSDLDLPARIGARNIAYVIYTSGSTGRPKGVAVEHRALDAYLDWAVPRYRVEECAGAPIVTSLGFDATITSIWPPLLTGRTIFILPRRDSLVALRDLVADSKPLLVKMTPAHLQALGALTGPSVGRLAEHRFVVGGEALSGSMLRSWTDRHPNVTVVNEYGPTETVVGCCIHQVGTSDSGREAIPIGEPTPGTVLYVLDHNLQPAPAGSTAELYINGSQVARGYLNGAALTADRFVADPFGAPGARMYRTGDLARTRSDGTFEFRGRSDSQVKLRGFRIELGEIENVFRKHDDVDDATVVLRGEPGHERLIAYVRSASTDPTLQARLRIHADTHLPRYMTPGAIVVRTEWPLTISGKVDHSRLPDVPARDAGIAVREPRTAVEHVLCQLFGELLRVDKAGVDDDFFALGGHSLLATQLVSRIRAMLDVEVPLRSIFEYPTPAQLAGALTGAPKGRPPLRRYPQSEAVPLSPAQRRLFFLAQLEAGRTPYVTHCATRIRGPLDVAALRSAIDALIKRHAVLRTAYRSIDGEVAQVVLENVSVPVTVEDLAPTDVHGALKAALTLETDAPFDLSIGEVIRCRLLRVSAADHVLLRVCHHVAWDGWSENVFNQELTELYRANVSGSEPALPPLAIQYADYAIWTNDRARDGTWQNGIEYWERQLDGAPQHIALPSRVSGRTGSQIETEVVKAACDEALTRQCQLLAESQHATLYMLALSAFAVVLGRYSAQDEVIVGSPVANRGSSELEGLIGCFVNTVALRVRLLPHLSVTELLAHVRRTSLDAFRFQDVPFENVIERVALPHDRGGQPVVQVVLAMQHRPERSVQLTGTSAERVSWRGKSGRCDLEVFVIDCDGRLEWNWIYNVDRFAHDQVQRFADAVNCVLSAMCADASSLIGNLPLSRPTESPAESQLPIDEPADILLQFEGQVVRHPDSVALVEGCEAITYRALNQRAAALANLLASLGVGTESRVGVCMPRSANFVVTMLAVFRAGATFVPIDSTLPRQRIEQLLFDARPSLVIVGNSTVSRIPSDRLTINLDQKHPTLGVSDSCQTAMPRRAGRAAYVMFTSGSSGRPKGVVISHLSLSNKIATLNTFLRVSPDTRYAASTATSFDPIFEQILCPLTAGATCELMSDEVRSDVRGAASYLADHGVTIFNAVPSVLQVLLSDRPEHLSLDTIISGGDLLTGDLASHLLSGGFARRLLNFYGPTETCIDATAFDVRPDSAAPSVPIGVPLPRYVVHVLDSRMHPVPDGAKGELYIAGAGLARGYLDRSGLTAASFVANPFGASGGRMYRTGDIVRRGAENALEFYGRADSQIKLRGLRIELGEIEAHLRRDSRVLDAAVIVQTDGSIDHLVAYIHLRSDQQEVIADLDSRLSAGLPRYMVPTVIVPVDSWPLGTEGKLNRAALPRADLTTRAKRRQPGTEAEVELCQLFAELLGVGALGVDDSFFSLGGHSLLAMRLVARIRQRFDEQFNLRAFFENPTVSGVASRLSSVASQRPRLIPQDRTALPTSYGQRSLWFLSQSFPKSTAYHLLTGWRLRGALDISALHSAIQGIVARHEILRTTFTFIDDELRQVVHPNLPIPIEVESLSAATDERIADVLRAEREKPFDLSAGPLLRFRVLRINDVDHVLIRTCHHIVSDAWSEQILNMELSALYSAFRDGRPAELGPLSVQYADYSKWQHEWLASGPLTAGLEFWRSYLHESPEQLTLPVERPRPRVPAFQGALYTTRIGSRMLDNLRELAERNDATLQMVLLSAYAASLSRTAGQDDLVIGVPVANRPDPQLEHLIGYFINTLPVRVRVKTNQPATQFLRQVRASILSAYEHQDIPFERIVEALARRRHRNMAPLAQALFAFRDAPAAPPRLAGLVTDTLSGGSTSVRTDIELHAWPEGDGLGLRWLYDKNLFNPAMIKRLDKVFLGILERTITEMLPSSVRPVRPFGLHDDVL